MAGLIVFDPDDESVGLTTGDDVAVNSYLDIENDELYFTDGFAILQWEGDPTARQTYTWRSGEVRMPGPVNMGAAVVEADTYNIPAVFDDGDPFYDDAILIAKFNGTNGATAYTELARSEPMLVLGPTALSNTQSLEGGTSLSIGTPNPFAGARFGAAADDWAAYQLSNTDDLTVEVFFNLTNFGATNSTTGLVSARSQDANNFEFLLLRDGTGRHQLRGRTGFGSIPVTPDIAQPILGQWYYACMQKRYNNGTPFIDFFYGPAGGTATRVASIQNSNTPSGGSEDPITIGYFADTGGPQGFMDGFIEGVRVTKRARYGDVASIPVPDPDYPEVQQQQTRAEETITFRLYAEGVLKHTQIVTDDEPFSLPGGYLSSIFSVEIESTLPVTRFAVAENIFELSAEE